MKRAKIFCNIFKSTLVSFFIGVSNFNELHFEKTAFYDDNEDNECSKMKSGV